MKKLGKIVGIGVGGYAIVNALLWAYVGIGCFLKEAITDEYRNLIGEHEFEKAIQYLIDKEHKVDKIAKRGWKNLQKWPC